MNRFLHLLRSGLWSRPANPALFVGMKRSDWECLYEAASRQAVLGLVYDGLSTLPVSLQPDRALLLQWFMQVVNIEKNNRRINQTLVQFDTEMQTLGVHYLVLKGPSVATCYPNPLHRQTGDIDIFLQTQEDDRTANLWAQVEGDGHATSIKHSGFRWHDVRFELHPRIDELYNPFICYKAKRHRRQCTDETASATVGINGHAIATLPPEAHFFYLMMHIFTHLMTGGIGLRQLCDCAVYATTYEGQFDGQRLRNLLNSVGLSRFADAFATLLINFLGLDSQAMPYQFTEDKLAEEILRDILTGGNFGAYHRHGKAPRGKWAHKLYTTRIVIKRCMRFSALGIREAAWIPAYYAVRNIQLLIR